MNRASAACIGTAGWTVPAAERPTGSGAVSHLQHYATTLDAVEINSSFHRHHRLETYRRWADTVPAHFQFAVKIPKAISHQSGLRAYREVLDRFCMEIAGLGPKLGVVLLQLPPRLQFEPRVAGKFFRDLRARVDALIACEPRHSSWGSERANQTLVRCGVARVAADPCPWAGGDVPGGSDAFTYFRQHGSPRMYYSNYDEEALRHLSSQLRKTHASRNWCIFDNTVTGHAYANARALRALLGAAARPCKSRAPPARGPS
jgi:uncharacterized protein YecE (DUF72 family)